MRKCVHDALPYGRENAIPSKTLAQILGFHSVRDLQKAVEAERAAGYVILCDSQGAGYYRSNDPDELRRFTRTLYARARNTMRAAESAQRALDAATGQMRLPGWFSEETVENEKKPPSGGRSPEDGDANNDIGSVNDSGMIPQKRRLKICWKRWGWMLLTTMWTSWLPLSLTRGRALKITMRPS